MDVTYNTEYGSYSMIKNDTFIAGEFAKGSHWEQEIIKLMIKIISGKNFNIINVGSHVGTTIIPLSKHANKVVCFEPQTKIYELLLKNIIQNKAFNITAVKGVVCNSDIGKVSLSNKDHSGQVENEVSFNYGGVSIGKGGELVDSYILDEFLPNFKLDLLFIDAEGSEDSVIESAHNLIIKNKPMILVEQNFMRVSEEVRSEFGMNTFTDIEYILMQCDYNIYFQLPDHNRLYLPLKGIKTLDKKLYKDSFNDVWEFSTEEDKSLYQLTNFRGPFNYAYIDESSIVVNFESEKLMLGVLNNNNIHWDNGTMWSLLDENNDPNYCKEISNIEEIISEIDQIPHCGTFDIIED